MEVAGEELSGASGSRSSISIVLHKARGRTLPSWHARLWSKKMSWESTGQKPAALAPEGNWFCCETNERFTSIFSYIQKCRVSWSWLVAHWTQIHAKNIKFTYKNQNTGRYGPIWVMGAEDYISDGAISAATTLIRKGCWIFYLRNVMKLWMTTIYA